MSTFTDHHDSLESNNVIAGANLDAFTSERDRYAVGSVNYIYWDGKVTEQTTKEANGVLAIAAQTAIEST